MKKNFTAAAALLLILCLSLSVFPFTAKAGSSTTTIDSSSFAEKLDNTVWNCPNGDVLPQNGKLIFSAESTEETRLISKNAVSKSELTENMLQGAFTLTATNIPEGKSFIFALGLRSIESMPGEKGNVEIVITNDHGLKAGLLVYEADQTPTALVEPVTVAKNKITVSVMLTRDQSFTVKLNGNALYNGILPVSGEGRVGFLQTGGCEAEISGLKLQTYRYDTPENTNVFENFDNGTMDTSVLSCSMIKDFGYYPCSIQVGEYNGNNMMLFQNSGLGSIGTKFRYSNFELTFDIPYIQREEVYSDTHELLMPKSSWFGISFGDEYMDATWYDYDYKSPYMIYFSEWSGIVDFKNNFKVLADLSSSKHAFFAENETRGFSVLFSVIDAHVSIGIKWMDEEEFVIVSEYDLPNGQTPTGYIHIWGSEPNNFAIDNIQIKNMDLNPQLIETEYKAGTVIVPEDYVFERSPMVFKEEATPQTPDVNEQEQPVNLNWLIPSAAAVSVLMVLVSVLFIKGRKRKDVA